ncbi:cation:proton antiporter [Algoriphagus namhaensis]
MTLQDIHSAIELPITHQGIKFFLILLIILLSPLLLQRFRIPSLLGLILAGAAIGPNGFGVLERDSGILLSGTAGLLYIMFLAGLEIDLVDFKKNSKKSLVFGMYTFWIPIAMGFMVFFYFFDFTIPSSVLLASMFASHTLIAYPILSKLGVTKNRAVNVTVGGTLVTDLLALMVLAVVIGMQKGEVTSFFWVKLIGSILVMATALILAIPPFGRWFLRKYADAVTQYIFVLMLVFFGAILAELAGAEGIIGAFLIGLALNPLIHRTSPLMNRIEFVGNAIFIPFFLLSVGMLVDFRVFISDRETIWIAAAMTAVAMSSKYLAAWFTQKTFGYSLAERKIIFGLSNAQAAATLAAVLVGYNTIIGEDSLGMPIRLLSESVLNGTLIMVLVTCTVATLQAQKGAQLIATQSGPNEHKITTFERFLIPVRNSGTSANLVQLALSLKSPGKENTLYGLSIISPENRGNQAEEQAQKLLNEASKVAASSGQTLIELLRYDADIAHGISGIVYENKITDLILGLHVQQTEQDNFLGKITNQLLERVNATLYIYSPLDDFSNLKRHLVLIPPNAEEEVGFQFLIDKIWNLAVHTKARMICYTSSAIRSILEKRMATQSIRVDFRPFPSWDDPSNLHILLKPQDNLILVLSRKGKPSYHPNMELMPQLVDTWLRSRSFLLIYPNPLEVKATATHDFFQG